MKRKKLTSIGSVHIDKQEYQQKGISCIFLCYTYCADTHSEQQKLTLTQIWKCVYVSVCCVCMYASRVENVVRSCHWWYLDTGLTKIELCQVNKKMSSNSSNNKTRRKQTEQEKPKNEQPFGMYVSIDWINLYLREWEQLAEEEKEKKSVYTSSINLF